jgi:hypothetical protein
LSAGARLRDGRVAASAAAAASGVQDGGERLDFVDLAVIRINLPAGGHQGLFRAGNMDRGM